MRRYGRVGLVVSCSAFAADITPKKAAEVSFAEPSAVSWTGFYLGGHMGYAWGTSNWAASTAAAPAQTFATGSLNLAQPIDTFNEAGSFFEGIQCGYNYRLPNNLVIGAEADAIFSRLPEAQTDLSIGGISTLASPLRLGNLQRDGAHIRHCPRPPRLCARQLALLCNRRRGVDL